jgi:5-methylcytosine-specific restriction endonuclease McrA
VALSKKALGTARWKKTRLAVLARDGYICSYCGQEADQVDHIQSRVSGGDIFNLENLTSACRRCNQSKGARAKPLFFRSGSTPPVFPAFISPTRSEIHQDSPFTARPVQS